MTNTQLQAALEESRRTTRSRCSEAEWAVRVELAACYRLIAHHRMTDWIYNHISAAVPGEPGRYLVNAFGLLYEEISASNLVKVDILLAGEPVDAFSMIIHRDKAAMRGPLRRCALKTAITCTWRMRSRGGSIR